MEIDDSFIRELISILNEIAIKRKSTNKFKSFIAETDVDGLVHIHLSVIYFSKEHQEDISFFSYRSVLNENLTREDVIDSFKASLIEAIIYYKNYLDNIISVVSMGTLLSRPVIEKKVFNNYEKYLIEEEEENDEY